MLAVQFASLTGASERIFVCIGKGGGATVCLDQRDQFVTALAGQEAGHQEEVKFSARKLAQAGRARKPLLDSSRQNHLARWRRRPDGGGMRNVHSNRCATTFDA